MNEWKVVPRYPTTEMIDAGRWAEFGEETSRLHDVDDDEVAGVWALMLAAAPKPPERKPLTDEQIRDLLESEFLGGPGNRDLQDDLRIVRAIEAAHGIK